MKLGCNVMSPRIELGCDVMSPQIARLDLMAPSAELQRWGRPLYCFALACDRL